MTGQELLDYTRKYLLRDKNTPPLFPNDLLVRYLDEGQQRLVERTHAYVEADREVEISTGETLYPLDADIAFVYQVRLDGLYNNLVDVTESWLPTDTAVMRPNRFATDTATQSIRFYPAPDTNYTAILRVAKLPDTITLDNLDDELELKARYQLILADSNRAQDAIVAQFAGRRFPLPADVSASAILQIQQKTQDLQAESSRKIAIMSVEQYKWVVGQIVAQRELVLKYALEYTKTVTASPEIISKMMGIGYDIQTKLISAAAQFYNADAQAKEVIAKVGQFNTSTALEADKLNQASKLTIIEDNLKALLGEVAAIAQQATALFNNLHVQASMNAGGTTVSTQQI